MFFEQIDDIILDNTNTERWITASNICHMADESLSVIDRSDEADVSCSEEVVLFRCGVLVEQGKLQVELVRVDEHEYIVMFKRLEK